MFRVCLYISVQMWQEMDQEQNINENESVVCCTDWLGAYQASFYSVAGLGNEHGEHGGPGDDVQDDPEDDEG